MAIQLTPNEKKLIKQILAQYLQKTPWRIFGSRAKGSAKRYSDLDIALLTEKPISLALLSALEEAFADSDLSFKIDLVDWQRLTPEFQKKIQSEWLKI